MGKLVTDGKYIDGIECSKLTPFGLQVDLNEKDYLDEDFDDCDFMVLILKYAESINKHLAEWQLREKVKNYRILSFEYVENTLCLYIKFIPEK